MTVRDRIHAMVERILPWFDPEEKARRDARTETIRQRSIAVRIQTERIRAAYRQAADRVER
jgi:hypothetical protein